MKDTFGPTNTIKNVIGFLKLTLILKLSDLSYGHPVLSLVLVDELVDW